MMIFQHDSFYMWLTGQIEGDYDIGGELVSLITELETEGESLLIGHDECHPVVTSPYLFALRRTPPTNVTPYATRPPVLRMLFSLIEHEGNVGAVMLLGGDKTRLGNLWYPPNIGEAHLRLQRWCTTKSIVRIKVRNSK